MKILLTILFLILVNNCYSQKFLESPSSYQSLGVFADYNFNYHNTNFNELPGVPNCCPKFSNGTGMGISVGVVYQYPFSEIFSAGLRFGYYFINGNLKSSEYEYMIIDDNLEFAKIEHLLDANLVSMGFEPFLSFKIYKELSIFAGFKAGYLIQKEYYQVERLVYPEDRGTFENGQRSRNESSGDIIESSNFLMFASAGFNYDIILSRDGNILLSPGIVYSFGLNDILNEKDWKVSFLRFGITIKYLPGFELDTPVEPK